MAAKPTRGAKVVKPCQWCGKDHEVRRADLNRGWGKYCSKRCKAMEQESRTGQNAGYLDRDFDREMDNHGHIFESGYFGHGQE